MKEFDIMVPGVLKKLHIGPHRKGYTYLKETLILINDGECKMMKEAYTILARKYSTTENAIEVAVRRSIREGIMECSSETKIEIFGYDVEVENRSNRDYYQAKEFIPYIVSYINDKLE